MSTDLGPVLLIGAGGLVGQHVHARLQRTGHLVRTVNVPWTDPDASVVVLKEALRSFANVPDGVRWTVFWAAGAGVVATSEGDLADELSVFETASLALEESRGDGAFVFFSSAGEVYAGSDQPPFTEMTTPRPLVAYGRTKLAMEGALTKATKACGLKTLILRPSNVYGPGQRRDKAQGLITQICRSQVLGTPLRVYVSQDTVRDYVFAPDVAALAVQAAQRLHRETFGPPVIKVVASGAPVTIRAVIATARRITRRPPRTITAANSSPGQVLDLRFRSVVWNDLDRILSTPMATGLAATARAELREHAEKV